MLDLVLVGLGPLDGNDPEALTPAKVAAAIQEMFANLADKIRADLREGRAVRLKNGKIIAAP
jgi:hypothetical protein